MVGKEGVMRQALPITVVASLFAGTILAATVVDVVAAGLKTAAAGERLYSAASVSAIKVAVPSSLSNFPSELLPQ
jgi:hypothetical protein